MSHTVKIKSIEPLTHDVLKFVLEKLPGFTFVPGQAADFAINQPNWEKEWRTFTFTSLPEDNHLEFNIKTYTDHNGVTNELRNLKVGDEVIIGDVYGDIRYKGEGIFIAGGAGITPFIAILKDLEQKGQLRNNKLIFANKTQKDIIQKPLLNKMLGDKFINILSDENVPGFEHGFVSAAIINKHRENNHQHFYLCGPPPMMKAVEQHLASLGINEENIVKEGF
ncbi:MAG: FAD-binding oxidoreductase [Bacteroidia bacterium]|nr:FAD-binding oxidoreductase [Bacteroidia bacterium]